MQSFLRSTRRRRIATLGALSTSALLLAACSSGEAPAGSEGGGEGDKVLSIASILPQTGNLEYLGPPEFAGVQLAIKDLEAAGYEFEIEYMERDSGDTTTDIATQATEEAVRQGVDLVVGAASSGVSFTMIDKLIDAETLMISPANTSPKFTDYDDDGFYWRTAPSDVLQGRVLGNLIVADGAQRVAFITVNDPYGTGLQENAALAVEAAGGEVVANELYNPGETNFQSIAQSVANAKPDAIALVAFAETAQMVPELVTNGFTGPQMYFVDGNLANSYEFPEGTLEGAQGTSPGNRADEGFTKRLMEVDPELKDLTYGPESYDAVILSALAAAQGGSADAKTMRDNLQSVSEGGEKCTEVKACLELIAADTDIDYDGPSGPITFDENGDPTEAYIGIYKYAADNRYTFQKTEFGSLNE